MKKTILTLVICSTTFLSCTTQQKKLSLDNEIEKWKKGLVLTGELGPPCYDDFMKWRKENPDKAYGISDEIKIFKKDFNKDGIEDAFVSMRIGDPCNGSNHLSSDHSVLIFSNDGEYYQDVKLTERIEGKIINQLAEKNIPSVNNLLTFFESFDGTINGEVTIEVEGDAHCCPSYFGLFKYNPNTQELKLEVNKKQ
ncbi:hypothetical protein D1J36_009200 [Riemerella anatipestifer]|uniref:hypothetical protein n=1 Tax=Riemerella anatipestifer TaxID=34085 RepID=UPI0012AE51D3|nr:hypothetical protein [Riemerella anatipestifer]USL95444.1 hypothetical protein D1J36_009200 [Riemerella anatipestifer]